MKNVFFILITFCAAFLSCDMLDVSDVGYGDGDRLKASTVKEALYAAPNGWKMNYGDCDFFFQFNEDGTVLLDSKLLKEAENTSVSFGTKGKQVELAIEGGGHFAYLDSEYEEDKLIVSAVSATRITCKGEKNGKDMILVPAEAGEMAQNAEKKAELMILVSSGVLDNGVIRNQDGRFVAHYVLDIDYQRDEMTFKLLTIEKSAGEEMGYTQQQTASLTRNDKVFTLDRALSFKDGQFSISSVVCDYDKKTVTFVGSGGVDALVVSSNKDVVEEFDYKAGWTKKYEFGKLKSVGAASDNIWNETDGGFEDPSVGMEMLAIDIMQFGDWDSRRPIVFWFSKDGYRTIGWRGSQSGASILLNNEIDRIGFTAQDMETGMNGMNDEQIVAVTTKLKNLLAGWFDEDGFYVVKEVEANDDVYFYLLSPTKGNWVKCKRLEYSN